MIKASIHKCHFTGYKCDNKSCKHNPKYHDNVLGNVWFIKKDSVILIIELGDNAREMYCRECIDILYQELKPVLNSKLWIFQ